MPPYTAVITTEILSNSTRNATYYDIAHARDEGGKVFSKVLVVKKNSNYRATRSVQARIFIFLGK